MLSAKKTEEYILELTEAYYFCLIIVKGTSNLAPAIKQNRMHKEIEMEAKPYAGDIVEFEKKVTFNTKVICFQFYVATFERIAYKIFKSALSKTSQIISDLENVRVNKDFYSYYNGGLQLFAPIKKDDHFFPFKEIENLINAKDKDFIENIISLRNYFAHGSKEGKKMKNITFPMDVKLIPNMKYIHTELTRIIIGLSE